MTETPTCERCGREGEPETGVKGGLCYVCDHKVNVEGADE